MNKIKFPFLFLLILSFVGCDYFQRKEFRTERADTYYQSAMADYSAGRLDSAIEGFKKSIRANPGNASARFQLACLLQDQKHDYLGALCGYNEYLMLATGGDKIKMAKERVAMCERLFLAEMAKKKNLSDGSELLKELKEVRKQNEEYVKRFEKISLAFTEIEAKNKTLSDENLRLRRMLSTVGDEVETTKKMNVSEAKALLEDSDGDRLKLSPDARALFDEEEKSDAPQIADSAKRASEGVNDNGSELLPRGGESSEYKGPKLTELSSEISRTSSGKKEHPHEERPEYYVVQDGDTLYKISLRFYGRRDAWKKILDANKAIISSDARIRAGQKLRLP